MFAAVQILCTNILLISVTACALSQCVFLLLASLKKVIKSLLPFVFFFYVQRPPSIDFSVVIRGVHLLTPAKPWPRIASLNCVFTLDISHSTEGGSNISTVLPAGFSLNIPQHEGREAAGRSRRCGFLSIGLQGILAWLFDVCGRCHHLELTVSRVVMTSNRRWSPVSGA